MPPNSSEEKTFSAVIVDAMKAQGMTFEKLVQATGISDRFLGLILNENLDKLPASPYVHGYIMKIAEVLRLDGERIWMEYFKDSHGVRRSGAADMLPGRRLDPRHRPRKVFILGIAIIVLVLGYVAFRIQQSVGEPVLSTNITDNMKVTAAEFDVKGSIDPKDQISLNGTQLYPDPRGNFEEKIELQPGFNTLSFDVKKFLGNEYTTNKQIFYQASSTLPAGLEQALPTESGRATSSFETGNATTTAQ